MTNKPNINLCFIARDIESNYQNLNNLFINLNYNFPTVNIVCYENDSTDQTVKLLRQTKNILLESETLEVEKFKSNKSLNRLNFLSYCRNKYLEKIRELFSDSEITVVVDSDISFYNTVKIVKNIQKVNEDENIDAIFSNGLDFFEREGFTKSVYYDILPLVIDGFSCNDKVRNCFTGTMKKVQSAFGGVGIYKTEKFIKGSYSTINVADKSGRIHTLCDHAGLNLAISGNFYIDPSFLIMR